MVLKDKNMDMFFKVRKSRFLDVLKYWDWQTEEWIRRAKKDNFMPFCNATLKKLRLLESEKK